MKFIIPVVYELGRIAQQSLDQGSPDEINTVSAIGVVTARFVAQHFKISEAACTI